MRKGNVEVNKKYIDDAKKMAEDLLGLAQMGSGNGELRKQLRQFIKKSDNYLERIK